MPRGRAVVWAIGFVALVVSACSGGAETQGTVHLDGAPMFVFDSVQEMADTSQLIVLGEVTKVVEGEFIPAPDTEDFLGTQNLEAVIQVESVLKGKVSPGDEIRVRWLGYEVNLDGTKGPQQIVNGQPPPEAGERDVWFLVDETSGFIPNGLAVTAYEGRVAVEPGGKLTLHAPVESPAARQVVDMDLETLVSLLDDGAVNEP